MVTVAFDAVTRRYSAEGRPAVNALDLQIDDKELLVLVGPSGSGKSTCLRMLAGLEPVDSGTIWIGDRDVTGAPTADRDIAMVFQNYALYPHLTVAQNLSFSLDLAHVLPDEVDRRVHEAADALGLQDLLGRKPSALSGGQRQRVAMGRAIVRSPKVFCMDEPLSNLDAQLRAATRTEIAALQSRLGVTTVYVTHDQVEAMTLGSRIAVLRDGELQQVDSPRTIYERPVNTFVAGFMGTPPMNLLQARVRDSALEVHGWSVPLTRRAQALMGGIECCLVGVRPEHWQLADHSDGMRASVDRLEDLGAEVLVHLSLQRAAANSDAPRVIVRVAPEQAPPAGGTLTLVPRATRITLFDRDSGRRLADTRD